LFVYECVYQCYTAFQSVEKGRIRVAEAMMTSNYEETLRGLAADDETLIASLLKIQPDTTAASGLDPKTHALVGIAALIALDAAPASFAQQVKRARERGATPQELLGVLVALAPTVGTARVVETAPELAYALGIDLEAKT
jgi:4-carboxymuconolactone decarboxylase